MDFKVIKQTGNLYCQVPSVPRPQDYLDAVGGISLLNVTPLPRLTTVKMAMLFSVFMRCGFLGKRQRLGEYRSSIFPKRWYVQSTRINNPEDQHRFVCFPTSLTSNGFLFSVALNHVFILRLSLNEVTELSFLNRTLIYFILIFQSQRFTLPLILNYSIFKP